MLQLFSRCFLSRLPNSLDQSLQNPLSLISSDWRVGSLLLYGSRKSYRGGMASQARIYYQRTVSRVKDFGLPPFLLLWRPFSVRRLRPLLTSCFCMAGEPSAQYCCHLQKHCTGRLGARSRRTWAHTMKSTDFCDSWSFTQVTPTLFLLLPSLSSDMCCYLER